MAELKVCLTVPGVSADAKPTSALRPLVEELHERRAAARLGGGEEKIAKQHAADKLTARERLALLIDDGTFTELGIHARPHFSQRAMEGRDAPEDEAERDRLASMIESVVEPLL